MQNFSCCNSCLLLDVPISRNVVSSAVATTDFPFVVMGSADMIRLLSFSMDIFVLTSLRPGRYVSHNDGVLSSELQSR